MAEQHTCSAQNSGNPDGCHHHYILRCTLLWTWLRSIPIFALVEQCWRFLKERERDLDGWSCFLIKDIVDTNRPRQQGCFCFFAGHTAMALGRESFVGVLVLEESRVLRHPDGSELPCVDDQCVAGMGG